jgi:hypothetical protein
MLGGYENLTDLDSQSNQKFLEEIIKSKNMRTNKACGNSLVY